MKALAPQVDVVIVVGCPNSSNSNRLREVAAHRGVPAYMVDHAGRAASRSGSRAQARVGVTAGASAPEVLVQQVIERLRALGARRVDELPASCETIVFPLPRGLHGSATGKAPETGPRS